VKYNFKCQNSDCGVVEEVIMPINSAKFDDRCCPRSKGTSKYLLTGAPAVMRSGATPAKAPIDVIVGKDAEQRWNYYHERQEKKDKIRRESGEMGLSLVGTNEFRPLTSEEKRIRNTNSNILASN
jgi:hypothetical protein